MGIEKWPHIGTFILLSYNLIKKYDVIGLTETALNEYISDETIKLDGYIPIRKDLPDGTTHGGVMLYHKESLPVSRRPDLESQKNSLVCEISINIFLSQFHTGVISMVMITNLIAF